MRYLKDFDYIIENMSQAKKILNDNGIERNDTRFVKITDKTQRDGYTGFITKLVFELGLELYSSLNLYDDLKELKIDVGSSEVKNIINNTKASNSEKIDEIIKIIRKYKKAAESKDFELALESNGYNIYLMNNYEGMLCTGSPGWCLKTKSYFDLYTKERGGTQFVAIDKRLIGDDDKFELSVPNTWSGERYTNTEFPQSRYGITIYPSGRIILFNDNNTETQITSRRGEITTKMVPFLKRMLEDTLDYYIKEIKPNLSKGKDLEGYADFQDSAGQALDDSGSDGSFNFMVERVFYDIDVMYRNFITSLKTILGVTTKEDIFVIMTKYIDEILRDDFFLHKCGIFDIFINDFVASSGGDGPRESLENYPHITKRAIPLGGYWIDEQPGPELMIKYQYGFQYEKYGIAAIEQGFGTVNAFYKNVADNFDEILDDDYGYLDTSHLLNSSKINKDFYEVTPYKDGYQVYIDFRDMIDMFYHESDDDKMDDFQEIYNNLEQWFKGTTIDGGEIFVPICSKPEELPKEE